VAALNSYAVNCADEDQREYCDVDESALKMGLLRSICAHVDLLELPVTEKDYCGRCQSDNAQESLIIDIVIPTAAPSEINVPSLSRNEASSPSFRKFIPPEMSRTEVPSFAPRESPSGSSLPSLEPSLSRNEASSQSSSPSFRKFNPPDMSQTEVPSFAPRESPSGSSLPSLEPSSSPSSSQDPTMLPTPEPTYWKTNPPHRSRTGNPSNNPSNSPSEEPTLSPTMNPSQYPTAATSKSVLPSKEASNFP